MATTILDAATVRYGSGVAVGIMAALTADNAPDMVEVDALTADDVALFRLALRDLGTVGVRDHGWYPEWETGRAMRMTGHAVYLLFVACYRVSVPGEGVACSANMRWLAREWAEDLADAVGVRFV